MSDFDFDFKEKIRKEIYDFETNEQEMLFKLVLVNSSDKSINITKIDKCGKRIAQAVWLWSENSDEENSSGIYHHP